ncbi:MAG: 16S rRNA (guanine(527)-N(7))-methyltransferase RsmG [Campylobacterota bacterium]|nr:16S rRNA (guanine(527)-N(7))-methyltransferase RsmG [Campylobacterota bacterium]
MMRLKDLLEQESVVLDEETIIKLEQFSKLLQEWNSVHNLTGAKSISAIYDNIIDSLYPLSFIANPRTLLDVGTGAGFPGLVLAIALPDTEVVLAEPLKKRIAFLRYAVMDLELTNVDAQGRRVEQIDHDPFELITSRAVTNTRLLLELTEELSDHQTAYLFYKGERVFDEIEDVQYQLSYDIVQKNRRNYLYIQP